MVAFKRRPPLRVCRRIRHQSPNTPSLGYPDARARHIPICARRGTAIAELAICLPVLVFIVFVSIELCNAKHLQQAITEAAYEGALIGSQPRATEVKVTQRIQAVLDARSITGTSIDVDGNGKTFDELTPGELFTVRVTAAVAGNIIRPMQFMTAPLLDAEVTGHKQE